MKRRGIGSNHRILGTLAVSAGVALGCGSAPSPMLGFDLPINRDVPVVVLDATGPDLGDGRDAQEPVDPGRDPGVDPGTDPGLGDLGMIDPGVDPGPPECDPGESRTVACGLNGRGEQRQVCVEGFWRDFDECIDPDECTDGEETSEPCGLNGRGSRTDSCIEGAWGAGECDDPDECIDGGARTVACGTKDLGQGDQACIEGAWGAQGGCRTPGRWQCVEDVCKPLFGASTCGNGDCEPKSGESPKTCPADCGGFAGTSGEGARCSDGFNCVFYDWPINGYGYWECAGVLAGRCRARADTRYCGTEGQDYCYFTQYVVESDQSCPLDCPGVSMACRGDYECIYHEWPEEVW